jgi:large subunit ribosomal protein L3
MGAIVGKKLGMTRVFDEDGTAIPVTVIEAQPNKITAIRRADRDGHDAVQLAGNPVAEKKLSGGELGHLKKAGAPAMADLAEFRDVEFKSRGADPSKEGEETPKEVDAPAADAADEGSAGEGSGGEDASSGGEERKVGDDVTVSDFQAGEAVKVSAISVGKGFQGTIRRHGFQRGPVTHGSHNVRAPGSVGASADPSRVFPGQKMPGRMGAARATQVGAEVVEVDAERNLLLIRGSVPGARNATVEVSSVG